MSSPGDRAVNLTDGELLKPLLVLSLPIIATNLMQVGYNLADTFWVGRLGQAAVSALSFSWAIVFLLISFSGGFGVAGTVLVAQNKGADNTGRSITSPARLSGSSPSSPWSSPASATWSPRNCSN